MAAENEKMEAVLNWLRQNLDHASAERVLSGPGLVNLHTALRALKGKKDDGITPAEISRRALSGDAHAHEALQLFFAMLGAFAGNLALTVGALGGVMIAGGIVPQLLPTFLASEFRFYFEAKGRFKSYLENIPAHVIIHPYPAFLGLAGLVNKS